MEIGIAGSSEESVNIPDVSEAGVGDQEYICKWTDTNEKRKKLLLQRGARKKKKFTNPRELCQKPD